MLLIYIYDIIIIINFHIVPDYKIENINDIFYKNNDLSMEKCQDTEKYN